MNKVNIEFKKGSEIIVPVQVTRSSTEDAKIKELREKLLQESVCPHDMHPLRRLLRDL